MDKKFWSIRGLFGQTVHYQDGKKVGESWPSLFGGAENHYDNDGNYIGSSEPGLIADMIHRDETGDIIGESHRGLFGQEIHYDDDGDEVGESWDTPFGTDSFFDDP